MDDESKMYDGLTLATLKKLRTLLPKFRKLPDDQRKLMQSKREKIESVLPADFTWAELYELSTQEMNILSMAVFGMLEPLAQAAREGLDLNEFMVNETIRGMELDDNDEDYDGGHNGMFKMHDVFALVQANLGMMLGLFYYGYYMNDLVTMSRNGDDNAFFKAVRVDQTVLAIPTFAARLARARIFGDENFMLRLHKATKSKPHEALLMNQDMRFMLQVLHEAKVLPALTLSEADLLFIKELNLYSNKGADPARSLMRFIQRWKAERQ